MGNNERAILEGKGEEERGVSGGGGELYVEAAE
jgi:hypothetical protein